MFKHGVNETMTRILFTDKFSLCGDRHTVRLLSIKFKIKHPHFNLQKVCSQYDSDLSFLFN